MTTSTDEAAIHLTPVGDGVVVVAFGRPPVNALNWAMKHRLRTVLDELATAPDVRVVVFVSDLKRVFCAGSDLYELAADHGTPGAATTRTCFEFELWQLLSSLPQQTIAAIDGHALGSGLELAIACDFRVAGAGASLGLPEVKIGGAPGIQTLARLPQLVGVGRARTMLMLGESLSADDARGAGLVDILAPAGAARTSALELAERLSGLPASSHRFLKSALRAATDGALDAVERAVMGDVEALFLAPEMDEGIRAFLEKRQARFPGVPQGTREPA